MQPSQLRITQDGTEEKPLVSKIIKKGGNTIHILSQWPILKMKRENVLNMEYLELGELRDAKIVLLKMATELFSETVHINGRSCN